MIRSRPEQGTWARNRKGPTPANVLNALAGVAFPNSFRGLFDAESNIAENPGKIAVSGETNSFCSQAELIGNRFHNDGARDQILRRKSITQRVEVFPDFPANRGRRNP